MQQSGAAILKPGDATFSLSPVGASDQTQIQAALDATGVGGVVLLGIGTYALSAGVTVPTGVTLAGSGYGTLLNFTHATQDCITANGTSGVHKANIRITNLRIVGPGAGGSTGNGIKADYVDGLQVDNCWITATGSASDSGAIYPRRCTDIRLLNNICWLNQNGICTGTSGAFTFPEIDRGVIANNTCFSNTDDGIHGQGGQRVTYANNICYSNSESGIDLLGERYDTVIGNLCYSNTQNGIEVGFNDATYYDRNHSITGNVSIANTLGGIRLQGGAKDCVISGNNFSGNTGSGVFIQATSAQEGTIRNLVSGNVCQANGAHGIRIGGKADTCSVVANICHTNTTSQIFVDNASVAPAGTLISGNYISGTGSINNTGTATVIRENPGYVTRAYGSTSVADGGTITHGLAATPTRVTANSVTALEIVTITAKGATTFTVAKKTNAGLAGVTGNVDWEAEI